MTTVTALRDALLAKFDAAAWTAIGSYANATFAADVDDLIAAAQQEARAGLYDAIVAAGKAVDAALTPERLAKALHEASVRIECRAAAQSDVHRMDHREDAAAILAALATDEAVP